VGRCIERLTEVLRIWMLTCLCLLFLSGSAWAEDSELLVPRHTFGIGVGVSYYDYVEDLPPFDIKVDGLMYGVIGNYTYHNKIMFNASLEYSRGDLDYDGSFQRRVPVKADQEVWIVESRGLIGYDYKFGGKHMVTPFLGIGYRYANDDQKPEPRGWERELEYWYSPIGIRTLSPLSDNWTWGMSLEYDLFWDGEADYDVPTLPTIDFDSGYGARFSLRFGRQMTENAALSFEPYITYWDIDETDGEAWPERGGRVYEPDNETTTYGLRVSVEF